MSLLKLNYRYARSDAPLSLLLLDKIIRAKHGLFFTSLILAIYNYTQSPKIEGRGLMAFIEMVFFIFPFVFWIFEIRKHGLRRGSREWLRQISGKIEARGMAIFIMYESRTLRRIERSFVVRWYKRLPKIVKTFCLLFWYGVPSYWAYGLLRNIKPSADTVTAMNILKNLFPNITVRESDSLAIVYGGGLAAIGLLHFLFSLGNQILDKLNRRVSITFAFRR